MIIETIPHNAIPYKCTHCESMYLWKPSTDGNCSFRGTSHKCEKSDCYYYEIDNEVRCPFCKDKYEQERISPFRYKIARALRRK